MKSIVKRCFAFLVLIIVIACQFIEKPCLDNANKVLAATYEISKSSATLVVGDTLQLKIKNLSEKTTVTWESSNKSIAAVNKKGKVTAKSIGKATITCIISKKKLTCEITVKNKNEKPNIDVMLAYIENYSTDGKVPCAFLCIYNGGSKVLTLNSEMTYTNNSSVTEKLYIPDLDNQTFLLSQEIMPSTSYKFELVTLMKKDLSSFYIDELSELQFTFYYDGNVYSCTAKTAEAWNNWKLITDNSDMIDTQSSNYENMGGYALLLLNKILKNPSSLIINDIYYGTSHDYISDKDVLVIDYNATNSFGGSVRSYATVFLVKSASNFNYNIDTQDLGIVMINISDSEPNVTDKKSVSIDNCYKYKEENKVKEYIIQVPTM